MHFDAVAVLLVIIGLLVAAVGVRVAIKADWIKGWLTGNFSLLCIAILVFICLCAYDLTGYSSMKKDTAVATVSFDKVSNHVYKATLLGADGMEEVYTLNGDLWRISYSTLTWTDMLASLGVAPGYRPASLTSQYYSLSLDRTRQPTTIELSETKPVDLHDILPSSGGGGLLSAGYTQTNPLPMADGALYEIVPAESRMTVKPLNDAARDAVEAW
jgi:hypothetical protein